MLNVQPDEAYEQGEQNVRGEISEHFKLQLNRPEILNRIGEKIVGIDFIRPAVALLIFDKMVAGILDRLADKQRIKATLPDAVKDVLREHGLRDLSNDGHGVAQQATRPRALRRRRDRRRHRDHHLARIHRRRADGAVAGA